ncbi:MAG: M20/M25/M40 family metallo-hydrolase, partial [Actinomycetota bacterium]
MNDRMLEELYELLRIPSISSGGGDPADLTRAARWLIDKIVRAGGTAGLADVPGNPLVVGHLPGPPDAPWVMIYGHYDVQSAEPEDEWDSPPFEPTIRGDRLYARGASDDKGNFFPLLYVACELAERGELPVNVKVVVEGEEEVGSDNIIDYIRNDDLHLDAAIIFDSLMINADTPSLTLSGRGMVMVSLDVTVGERNLHSGMYGGSALNAAHVLHGILSEVLPGPDGRLRPELREGIVEPSPLELESWEGLPEGESVIREVGGRPIWEGSGRDYYVQNWADASLDVSGVETGDAQQVRTIIPATARCKFSIRLAPGQDAERIRSNLDAILRDAIPEGADVAIEYTSICDPALFDAESEAVALAIEAFEEVTGKPPALTRIGGTLPILVALAERKIPTIISGYALAEDSIH